MTPTLYNQRRSRINPNHRLARGFSAGFLHNFGAGDALPGINLGIRTDLHMIASGWLNATRMAAKAPYRTFHIDRAASGTPGYVVGTGTTTLVIPAAADCCAFVLFWADSVSGALTNGALLSMRNGGNGNPIIDIVFGANGATTTNNKFIPLVRDDAGTLVQETTGVTVNDSLWHFAIVQRQGGVWYWSVDGSTLTSMGTANGALTFTPNTIAYGIETQNTGAIEKPQGDFAVGGLSIGYSLSQPEAVALARNPWQLFAAPKKRVSVNSVAAAGGAAIRLLFPYGMDGTGGGVTGQNRIH